MKRHTLLTVIILGIVIAASEKSNALDSHHSAHLTQTVLNEKKSEQYYDEYNDILPPSENRKPVECRLTKKVYGWHPYWYGTSYRSYEYPLLSTVSYFAYNLDPDTGDAANIHFWDTTPMVDLAKSGGSRIDLTVTNFGEKNNHKFLTDHKAQNKLIENIINQLKHREGNGVCIDFESIPASMRDNFSSFMQGLSKRVKSEIDDSTVSLTLYAVDWNNVFDIDKLEPVVDNFIVMAYDYHTSSSQNAGPVAPMKSGDIWWPYNVEKSVENYVKKGLPPSKILLSVPYYGQQWKTKNVDFPSRNLKHISMMPYRHIKTGLKDTRMGWDSVSESPYIVDTSNGDITQLWFDDPESLADKYEFVKERGLAGIGIFALGYDNGHQELWNVIKEHFCE